MRFEKGVWFCEAECLYHHSTLCFKECMRKHEISKESHECSFDTIELGRTMDSIKEFSWDIEPFSSYKSFFYPLIILDKLINYLPYSLKMRLAQTFIIIGVRNKVIGC